MSLDEIQYIQLLIFDFQNFLSSNWIGCFMTSIFKHVYEWIKAAYCLLTLASLLWIIYRWFLKYLLFCAFWNMLTSLYLFIAGSVLCLIGAFGYVDALQTSGLFNDEGVISYENNNGTLSEFTMSSFRCAAKCLQDMSCRHFAAHRKLDIVNSDKVPLLFSYEMTPSSLNNPDVCRAST